jgi:hypothetical protein
MTDTLEGGVRSPETKHLRESITSQLTGLTTIVTVYCKIYKKVLTLFWQHWMEFTCSMLRISVYEIAVATDWLSILTAMLDDTYLGSTTYMHGSSNAAATFICGLPIRKLLYVGSLKLARTPRRVA